MMGWIKDKIRKAKFGQPIIVTEEILYLIRNLFYWRLQNDIALRTSMQVSNPGLDVMQDADHIASACPLNTLADFADHHIVMLLAMYARMSVNTPGFNYRDILYNMDQLLPKRRGYIPVEMWSPENVFDYIGYRLTIDRPGELYPISNARAILELTLDELVNYYRAHPNA